jgi:tetratricopeptide (TPR) repeat protein
MSERSRRKRRRHEERAKTNSPRRDTERGVSNRGVPNWIWLAAAVIVMAALYWSKSTTWQEAPPPEVVEIDDSPLLPTVSFDATEHEMADETTAVLDRLTAAFPESPHAQSVKGNVLSLFGRSQEAMECWRQSIALDSQFAPGYRQIAGKLLEDGDYVEAAELLRQAIALDDTTVGVANQLADALMQTGEMQEAFDVLEAGVRAGTTAARTDYLFGQILLQLQEYDDARRHLLDAIEEDPEDTNAYYLLAQACAKLGQRTDSRKWLTEFKRLKAAEKVQGVDDMRAREDRARVRSYLATAYRESGKVYLLHRQIDSAEKHWLMAAALGNEDIESLAALGQLYRQQNDQMKLMKVQQQLCVIEPDSPIHALELGRSLLRLSQFDRAEAAFLRANELEPSRADVSAALALLYIQADRTDRRPSQFAQTAVQFEPSGANYFLLGVALQSEGDLAGALVAVRRAIESEPGNVRYRQVYDDLNQ